MTELQKPLEALVTDVRARQQAHWQAGERVLLESLLAGRPELAPDRESLLHLIYAEVLLREEYGERPGVEEYVRRVPDFAAEIRRQFAFHDAFGALDTDGPPPTSRTTMRGETAPRGTVETVREIGPYEIL